MRGYYYHVGAECNKSYLSHQLLILHVNTGRLTNIPVLRSSEGGAVATDPCGIHGLAINPSRTLLATGASNTHHIAVYHLPTFDPCCVGEVSVHMRTHMSVLVAVCRD